MEGRSSRPELPCYLEEDGDGAGGVVVGAALALACSKQESLSIDTLVGSSNELFERATAAALPPNEAVRSIGRPPPRTSIPATQRRSDVARRSTVTGVVDSLKSVLPLCAETLTASERSARN